MQFDLTYRNIRAAPALRDRAERKFAKVTKHLREPIEAHVVLSVEKHRHMAEVTVSSKGGNFKVEEESDDMYTTIDGLMAKLERSARRHRERAIDRKQAGSNDASDGFSALVEDAEDAEVN
jgi:putative sigma-54 modulation protein